MDGRIPELLRELASEMPIDPDLQGTTLRRARRRRARNATLTAAIVAVAVVGIVLGSRALLAPPPDRLSLGGDGSSRTAVPGDAFPGIFPQTSWDELERDQESVDAGHHPAWLDPGQVATEFATNVLCWSHEDVVVEGRVPGERTSVEIRDGSLAGGPSTTVTVEQLGRTGKDGIWTVTLVEGKIVRLDDPHPWTGVVTNETFAVVGRVDPSAEAAYVQATVQDTLLEKPATGEYASLGADGSFRLELAVPPSSDGVLVLVVRVLRDGEAGEVLAATAYPLRSAGDTETVTPIPGLQPQEGLPDAVAATRARIFDAAVAGDYEALAALTDPGGFTYSFGEGGDPARYWRQVERAGGAAPREVIPGLLNAPYGTQELGNGTTLHVWPFAAAMDDLSELTPEQREVLHTLGYSEQDIRSFIEFGGYVGWRLGITEDGAWIFYVAGD